MLIVKCISKFRNKNNQIYGYRLQDKTGQVKDVTSEQLKQAILKRQVQVINLKLTLDGRLIDTKPKTNRNKKEEYAMLTREIVEKINCNKHLTFKSNQNNIKNIASKSQLLGFNVIKISNNFIAIEKEESICLISSGQIKLDNTKNNKGLFSLTVFKSINFNEVNTSNVTNMRNMFYNCQAQTIALSSFDTSKVTNMNCMFFECQVKALDLRNFDTSKVTDMNCMFYGCHAQTLDLSSFDTSKVTDMGFMFKKCQAQTLDLSSFDTSKVTSMVGMFYNCQAQKLDLSSFNTSNVTDMRGMFYNCQAQIKVEDKKILKKLNN